MFQFVEVPHNKVFIIKVNGKRVSPFQSRFSHNRKSSWNRRSDAVLAIINSYNRGTRGQIPYFTKQQLQTLNIYQNLQQLLTNDILIQNRDINGDLLWEVLDSHGLTNYFLDNGIYIIQSIQI